MRSLSERYFLKRLFAQAYDRAIAPLERELADRRRSLLAKASGKILEIGCGTGANLEYLPADADWTGLEPNPFMTAKLRERFPARQVLSGSGESLPFDDAAFDCCVATLVLCSVSDLDQTLREIRRVLRPGGAFLFLEHIAAPRKTIARCLQSAIYWPWRCLGEGCRTNRNTLAAIERHFDQVDAQTYWVPWRAALGCLPSRWRRVVIARRRRTKHRLDASIESSRKP